MLTNDERYELQKALNNYSDNEGTEFGEDLDKLARCLRYYGDSGETWAKFDDALLLLIKETMEAAKEWECDMEEEFITEWREKNQHLLDKL